MNGAIDRDLQLIALRQLQAMLKAPTFSFDNPRQIAAAESLWLGARLARLSYRREQARAA